MKPRTQVAALPFVISKKSCKILLITSRETNRWIIPKGWPSSSRPPHRQAAREAYEEAGLVGVTGKRPLGSYKYQKVLDDGSAVPCVVTVFPMLVAKQARKWPEKGQRKSRWLKPSDAAVLVDEKDLTRLLRSFKPPTYLLAKAA
ncbi:MAG: NUDIX hydrolase [Pseudomonadota bacterium]